ncbi:hypothetical protein CesoFtcFv8_020242 [Champsocephalus esox]|uniref:Uncharacterized protein n=1 Tax=Champsocephalus esox TaxID=159716 RepID=A0AAN8GP13_9TELE|nr:hypothetical protein CesoFtcFv8_020242 [Champsocephalus esox]
MFTEPRETLKETSASSDTRVKDEDPDVDKHVAERPVYPTPPKAKKRLHPPRHNSYRRRSLKGTVQKD